MSQFDATAQLQQILKILISVSPDTVTYAQIEAAMEAIGLDPYAEVDLYTTVIDTLDERGIQVVDQQAPALPELDEDEAAEQVANEVVAELASYVRSVDEYNHPLLTAEQERRLLEIYRDGQHAKREQEGDLSPRQRSAAERRINAAEQALDELLRHNLRLVINIAYRVARHSSHLTLDDLIQEGWIGLVKAIERYDLDLGLRLSTYATWWIRQAVGRAYADMDRTIRLPVHVIETLSRLTQLSRATQERLGRTPTEEELSRLSGLNVDKIRLYLRMAGSHASLEKPIGNGDSVLGDFIASHYPAPEAEAEHQALREQIGEALSALSDRQRYVIIHRFGLADGERRTLEELGKELGLTRERIRQIEKKALRRLRPLLRNLVS